MISVLLRNMIALLLLTFIGNAMARSEPKFELLEKSDAFELRQYDPIIIAEVLVNGDMDKASGKGFRLLTDYIFGNKSQSGQSAKIAMSAPVTLKPQSEKITLTERKRLDMHLLLIFKTKILRNFNNA